MRLSMTIYDAGSELSMGRLDQARTRPEPKNNLSGKWARKSPKICLIQMQNYV